MLKCLQMDASGWESRCDQVWLYQTASLSTFETSNIGQVSSLQLKVATSSLLLSFRLTFSLPLVNFTMRPNIEHVLSSRLHYRKTINTFYVGFFWCCSCLCWMRIDETWSTTWLLMIQHADYAVIHIAHRWNISDGNQWPETFGQSRAAIDKSRICFERML